MTRPATGKMHDIKGVDCVTPRERLLTALAHREPDRVPLHWQYSEGEVRRMIESADLTDEERRRLSFGDVDIVSFAGRSNDPVFAPWHKATPPEAQMDDWGVAWLRHKDSGTVLLTKQHYFPLKDMTDPDELEDYPWPDMTDPMRCGHIEAEVTEAHAADRPVIGQMSQTIAELAYLLRPAERLFMDFYDNPEFVERLFDKIAAARCRQARILAEADVDVLRIGDDLATQKSLLVSPRTYRTWIKPRHAAVIAAARAVKPDIPVLYHSDGNVEALIPELIEIGVTAVNPVQPECMDPVAVKQRWGDRITIWGAIGSQSTLAFGTDADVDAEVADRMEKLAPGGGFVFCFTNVVWSPRARKNVFRYLMKIQELGVY